MDIFTAAYIAAALNTGALCFLVGYRLGQKEQVPAEPAPEPTHTYMDGYGDGFKVGHSRGLRTATAKVRDIADHAEKAAREARQRFSPCGEDVAPAERSR